MMFHLVFMNINQTEIKIGSAVLQYYSHEVVSRSRLIVLHMILVIHLFVYIISACLVLFVVVVDVFVFLVICI